VAGINEMLFFIENTMDDQADSEFTLHDLVAQGACYPLAMMVWHQFKPRGSTLTKAKLTSTMIHSSSAFEDADTAGDIEEAALNQCTQIRNHVNFPYPAFQARKC